MSQFLHDDDDNDYAKAIAIPWVFFENSRVEYQALTMFSRVILKEVDQG